MKIYRITYKTADDSGNITSRQEFAASDGAASKRITEIKLKYKETLEDKPARGPVEVPTNKADLIEWLNTNATIVGVVQG